MRFFVCLLDPAGRAVSEAVQEAYGALLRSRKLQLQWQSIASLAVLTGWDDPYGDPFIASHGDFIAVGTVRLDNRPEFKQWLVWNDDLSDLELVLHAVACHGTKYVPRFLGDFAFIVWNAATQTAVAACDAFAVKKLYYSGRNGLFAFASRGEAIALEGRYNVQYLAELVGLCPPSPRLSIYSGVEALPAGSIAVMEGGRLSIHQYWSAQNFALEPAWAMPEHEAVETCRELLAESVGLRLGRGMDTWAQLSGGIDSSSVVCVAEWLAARQTTTPGLAGSVTFVDSHGTGADEREYSDSVVSRWQHRNEVIVDAPIWHDDEYEPPYLDIPSTALVFYPRDRRLCAIMRSAGGRVLLTGAGGDNLFSGNMFFFADWLAHGRVRSTVREMTRRAALGRVSFWELAYRNSLLPLLPKPLQHRLVQDEGQMPAWLAKSVARQYELEARAAAPASYTGRVGRKYRDAVAGNVSSIAAALTFGLIEDTIDVRHPYLYRPLVEFALRLPPEMCARPNERKWILREAMRGILPDPVRTRVGKGSFFGLLTWSLGAHRALLEPLVAAPILSDLGVIDAAKLRAASVAALHEPDGRQRLPAAIQYTLAIEAWLQMRSGRWPCDVTLDKLRSQAI